MEMLGYYIKKWITFFIEPYGVILTFLLIGLFFLFTKKDKLAKGFISVSILLYLIFAYQPFSNFLIKNLETKYVKYEYKQPITYIHVLGSGNNVNTLEPISSKLDSAGVKRVLEGVIIYKRTPSSKLILTGCSGSCKEIPTAEVYAELAISLGVKKEDIIMGFEPKDTKEEAKFMKKIIGKKPFVLVTSASHMPRAMLLFQSTGLNPIAAPTDFHSSQYSYYSYSPSASSIVISKIAIHEYLGIIWAKIINII